MNGLLPFESAAEQTKETWSLALKQTAAVMIFTTAATLLVNYRV